MKILMLTPYLPFPLMTGGQTRSYNLIKRLAGLNHEITLFCLIKNEEDRKYVFELEKFCKEVQVFKRSSKPWTLTNILRTGFSLFPFLVVRNWALGEKKAVAKKIQENNFDLIHAETFYVMPHIAKTNIPIVLVDQTIEYLVYKHYVENFKINLLKPFLYFDVYKLKYWELRYWKAAKRVIAMSEDDKKIMQAELPNLKVDIVPNGVDSGLFGEKRFERSKSPVILYVGNFTWLQNREAVEILVKKVWPIIKSEMHDAKLWIIGKDAEKFFPNLSSDNIRVEEVKDVREAYQGAWVLVAPIYGAGGTRYKNFEAFASGLPVVTTSIGIGGTEAVDGKEVIIRDNPKQIAEATIDLLKNKILYKKISHQAKKMVKEKYDWESITKELNRIYQQAVSAAKSFAYQEVSSG